jgi:ribosomal protein S18 acetylase RimI-like enzyme
MQKIQPMHIRPTRESDAVSINDAINAIAAEKWYIATVDGFSLEETRAFIRRMVEGSLVQVVAVAGDQVVGLCDILVNPAKGFTHVGRLGMGVRAEWRQQGIGGRLLDACLSQVRSVAVEKIELDVYSDNVAAIRLYESRRFVHEGLKVRGRKLDDRYQDVKLMALWLST